MGKTYQAYLNGELGVGKDGGFGNYGGISWNTWLRLRDYKYNGRDFPLVEEKSIIPEGKSYFYTQYYIRITDSGIEYFKKEWSRYRELYPEIEVPEPKE